jgi:aminoglycoside 6'-N-acetyltransferase
MAIISSIPRPILLNTCTASESAASSQTAPDVADLPHHGHGAQRSHTAPGGRALSYRPANLQMLRPTSTANLSPETAPVEVPEQGHGHHHGGKSHHTKHSKEHRAPNQAWDRRLPRTNLLPSQMVKHHGQDEELDALKPESADAAISFSPVFTFVPLKRSDFALLGQWLATPHVQRWCCNSSEPAALETQYGAGMDGAPSGSVFIAYLGSTPVGLVQHRTWQDYPEHVRALAPTLIAPQSAQRVQYFLGPTSVLGSGFGAHMVQQFCAEMWQRLPHVSCLIASSHAKNYAALRTLQHAGFARVATLELIPANPVDDRMHCIYRLERA